MPVLRQGPLAAVSTLTLLALAACGAATDTADQKAASTDFSYEDARGTTVEIEGAPETVVGQASAAAALWDNGFEVAGVYGDLPANENYLLGDLDVDKTKVLGKAWGEFNVEEYAALDPDLLIDMTFDGKTLWYAGEVETQVEKLAPTLAMQLTGLSVTEQIEAFTDLAEKLGAEPDIDEAKADFDAAVDRIKAVVESTPDLTVLAMSSYGEEIYFANTPQHPDLAFLADLGVKFPEVKPDEAGIFEPVSLENIDKYDADVILVDARDTGGLAELKKKAIFNRLPAVAGGQQDLWYPAAPYSYEAYAEVFNSYADALEGAKVLTKS
ncbi:ABC transporter substrate-binding protein [Nocardioides sp.]|uniref:ABC transporter substrate-binding protein n=1 Tax=Nocardioides sp. TaxID=35761 RepID=UPI002D1D9477|nr:ABC transporter substrate-binding protein [Nocardioides sp.]HSX68663.1 ABC transporter substrate-binding protein [Nocardioides sp.]